MGECVCERERKKEREVGKQKRERNTVKNKKVNRDENTEAGKQMKGRKS